MSGNSAFTNQGATFPSNPTVPNILSGFQKPNPLTSALQSASGNYTPPSGSRSVGAVGSRGGYDTAPNIPSAPTSGIKKQTVISPTGHQVTTEYHAPTQGLPSSKDTPITGTATTPSGAQVDSTSGGLISGPTSNSYPAPSPSNPTSNSSVTYPGLINKLSTAGNEAKMQQNQTADEIAQLRQNLQTDTGVIQGQPQELNFQTGRINALQTQEAAKEGALQQKLQAQTAANSQNIGALGTAAGLVAPQLAGFNQQSFNPLTGQFGAGTGGNTALSQLPSQAQSAVQSYAQQVQNGQMTRADAESRLSAYGVAGTNALNEVLGSGFNTNASNASAGTTQQGQQIQTFAKSANAALDKLQSDFASLPGWQKAGVPGTVAIGQYIGQVFGNDKLSTFQTTLHDARSQLSGVLSTAGGMTPTGAQDTANTYLPDNMTPEQLSSKIAAAKALVEQKVQAFTQSGQQNNQTQNGTNNSSGSNIYSF